MSTTASILPTQEQLDSDEIYSAECRVSFQPTCYQCDKPVKYLFGDGRGSCCTRLTRAEIEGNVETDD